MRHCADGIRGHHTQFHANSSARSCQEAHMSESSLDEFRWVAEGPHRAVAANTCVKQRKDVTQSITTRMECRQYVRRTLRLNQRIYGIVNRLRIRRDDQD